jgi:hypothetical protein
MNVTPLSTVIAEWLQQLAADHVGVAFIVAKTVGSLMIEDGPEMWFKLNRISDLTEQSPAIVAGILHRLRRRGRLHFVRRDDPRAGVEAQRSRNIFFSLPAPTLWLAGAMTCGASQERARVSSPLRAGTVRWRSRSKK